MYMSNKYMYNGNCWWIASNIFSIPLWIIQHHPRRFVNLPEWKLVGKHFEVHLRIVQIVQSINLPPLMIDAANWMSMLNIDRHATFRSDSRDCATHLRICVLEYRNGTFSRIVIVPRSKEYPAMRPECTWSERSRTHPWNMHLRIIAGYNKPPCETNNSNYA